MVMGMQKPEAVCAEPKIFVGQIPHETTQEQVYALFSKYGTIKKCALITGQDGRSKGCSMVTFERWSEAELAIEHENGTANLGGGRTLLVKFADPPRGRGDGPVMGVAPKKLFVGQIPQHTTEQHIRTLFAPFGNITDVHVLNKGNAPGCAFVTFERWAQAEAAMLALNGQTLIEGATTPMVVKFADAKVQDNGMGPATQKRQFGALEGQPGFPGAVPGGLGNKRTFTGGAPGAMGMAGMAAAGYNPYAAAAAMGYDMSTMAAMGYGNMGMMAGMAGMQGMGGIPGQGNQQGMAGAGGMGGAQGIGAGGMGGMGGMGAMGGMGGGLMAGSMMGGMAGMGMMGLGMGAGMGMNKPAGLQEGPKAWKLFIGQVPFEANETDLWPIFSPLGNILELVILRHQGKSKGCAFLTYENRTDADKAIRQLDSQVSVPSDPRGRLLTVKYANSASAAAM
ncbi:hypothetical protein HYH03_002293 [Edaphochlamys debaryana]|uniref:RRM domain-containing protein n=1 Tax=Edaphochlamys debaryana TaxID=47281 RepID=A0A835YCC3_9CHLO|nr:hypothetical protein HYH03_002293 [Edaphochlamys debaryana]|eukprot:KAG2500011.1 hypothetical protein HYH03_002293 [Edaphochlamys debaryana]